MSVIKLSEIEKEQLSLPLSALDADAVARDIRSKAEIPKITDGIYEVAIQEIMEKPPQKEREKELSEKENARPQDAPAKKPKDREPVQDQNGGHLAQRENAQGKQSGGHKAQAKRANSSANRQEERIPKERRTEKASAQHAPSPKKEPVQPAPGKKPAPKKRPQFDEEGKTSFLSDMLPTINPVLKDLSTGEEIPLSTNPFTVGKLKSCDLCVNSKVVSRRHAEFRQDSDRLYIKDLGSTNGTLVDGFKLPPDTELEVKSGQEIVFANKKYKIRW